MPRESSSPAGMEMRLSQSGSGLWGGLYHETQASRVLQGQGQGPEQPLQHRSPAGLAVPPAASLPREAAGLLQPGGITAAMGNKAPRSPGLTGCLRSLLGNNPNTFRRFLSDLVDNNVWEWSSVTPARSRAASHGFVWDLSGSWGARRGYWPVPR